MKLALIILAGLTALQAHANVLRFQNLSKEWIPHAVKAGSPEARMAREAQAILNYKETPKSAEATVYVHEVALPEEALGNDVKAWHKFMFPGPATVGMKVIKEDVINVNGVWRYIIHYETLSGTGLQTIAMATTSNGRLQAFLVEDHRDVLKKVAKPVMNLYKSVAIHSTSN